MGRSNECSGKVAYLTHAAAAQACRIAKIHHGSRQIVYRCSYCYCWHCGNRSVPAKSKNDDPKRWKNWHWRKGE